MCQWSLISEPCKKADEAASLTIPVTTLRFSLSFGIVEVAEWNEDCAADEPAAAALLKESLDCNILINKKRMTADAFPLVAFSSLAIPECSSIWYFFFDFTESLKSDICSTLWPGITQVTTEIIVVVIVDCVVIGDIAHIVFKIIFIRQIGLHSSQSAFRCCIF